MNTPPFIVRYIDPYKFEANVDFMALHLEGCGAAVDRMIVIFARDFGHVSLLCFAVGAVPVG